MRSFALGRRDPFPFILARALGMTVAQLYRSMSNLEYEDWRAFYRWEAWTQELPGG